MADTARVPRGRGVAAGSPLTRLRGETTRTSHRARQGSERRLAARNPCLRAWRPRTDRPAEDHLILPHLCSTGKADGLLAPDVARTPGIEHGHLQSRLPAENRRGTSAGPTSLPTSPQEPLLEAPWSELLLWLPPGMTGCRDSQGVLSFLIGMYPVHPGFCRKHLATLLLSDNENGVHQQVLPLHRSCQEILEPRSPKTLVALSSSDAYSDDYPNCDF
ncbi:uncharacterized protein LOC119531473 [Choloepus didactylus]|uniref:uncharacterized protein LOC119531473 n=1 Tax=Choloepus didactylus TaxID=27675 RepID=UPI00189E3A62|nr:uncharacterized protein LOC119531473 [Choloepus didactylus]XP_037688701.1 uncharacterized protein LOC119531473 [Choloepus didactylus]XP_037688708.1 uncharacterized protein LOC119531473 [Choloepus didactylus]XP_037688713.1 uncharacterized protein LOC119531473 [Choloepus didactylus]XP_037688719.1 uncharacterized protein LOC119531473 [Choloepus didactylus]